MAFEAPSPTDADRRAVAGSGRCAACRHLQVLRSPRSTFVRCALAGVEPGFPRYPTLPVVRCSGFASAREDG